MTGARGATAGRRRRLRHLQRRLIAGVLAFAAQAAPAASACVDGWERERGTRAPLLEADDQSGERRTLETLRGRLDRYGLGRTRRGAPCPIRSAIPSQITWRPSASTAHPGTR